MYVAGDPIPGYLAAPSDASPWPGVMVLHQGYGLDDDIRRITDRVAAMGYLAVAPDLVDGRGWRCLARLFRDLRRGHGEAIEKLESVIAWIRARADCTGQVGTIGFCLGGGFAFLLGARGEVDAAAPSYGLAPRDFTSSCPVVASYGARDRLHRGQAAKARRLLAEAGVAQDVKVYQTAGHSFMNQSDGDHRLVELISQPFLAVGYDREAAEDAWSRIEAFFREHLSAGHQPRPA